MRDEAGNPGASPHSKTPTWILVLRAGWAWSEVGISDVRIWSHLDRERFRTSVVYWTDAGGKPAFAPVPRGVVVSVPPIPFLKWLVLNLQIIRCFMRSRFTLVVFTPRTWLSALALTALGACDRAILDVRSVPVHPKGFGIALEQMELKAALALPRIDGITAINERTLERIRGSIPPRTPSVCWGSGVDFGTFRPSAERRRSLRRTEGMDNAFVVIYHGTISADRGVIELIRAVELVRGSNVDARLLLVGGGSALPRIQSEFRHLIDAGIVVLHGPVAYEDVPRFIDGSDVGVLPFPHDPKWEAQMPLKLLEYIAMGKLVVATDMAAHRGYGEGVLLTPNNHPSVVAEGLLAAWRMSTEDRERRLEDSLTRIRALSWNDQARILAGFIQTILSDR